MTWPSPLPWLGIIGTLAPPDQPRAGLGGAGHQDHSRRHGGRAAGGPRPELGHPQGHVRGPGAHGPAGRGVRPDLKDRLEGET
jgi:hypothetical protein